MRIAVASDLHIEFGDINLMNGGNAELLVLAGDICMLKDLDKQSERGERTRNFFKRVSRDFPQTIYVMGNHEHYSGDFAKSRQKFLDFCEQHFIFNVKLLDKETYTLNGYLFIGGTLWTDFDNGNPLSLLQAEDYMSDYRAIKNTDDTAVWKFLPRHALADHEKMRDYLRICIESNTDNKIVVVTHHAPSPLSIHEKYKCEGIANTWFMSDLSQFIMDHPEIQLWIHGHVHNSFDYTIGSTRVYCNPRGYIQYEAQAFDFKLEYIDL